MAQRNLTPLIVRERLPAPFDTVFVETGSGGATTFVSYEGPAKSLIALNVVTRAMLKPKPGAKYRQDRHGRHFTRSTLSGGRFHVTIYIEPSEADQFPGSSVQHVQAARAAWEVKVGIRSKAAPFKRKRPEYLRLVVDNTREVRP